MNFKPTKWKLIIGILVVVAYILFWPWWNSISLCAICSGIIWDCVASGYENWLLIEPTCSCGCFGLGFFETMMKNLQDIALPFLFVYIIWSLFEKEKVGGKK